MRQLMIILWVLGMGVFTHAGTDFGTTALRCDTATEQTFRDGGAAGITVGNRNIYAAYEQLSNNQNPIIAAYSAVTGNRLFCRDDYEAPSEDSPRLTQND